MNLLAVVLAVAGAWFDADVAGSAKWPSGSDPVEIVGTGTWGGRGFVIGTGKSISYDEAYGTGLSFVPTVVRDAADGEVAFTTEMTFTERTRLAAPDGATVYYTLDGSDPRQRGGELNPAATVYDAEEGLSPCKGGWMRVNARARSAKGEWSALESVRLNMLSGTMLLFR